MTSNTERTDRFRRFLISSFAISVITLTALAAVMCWRIDALIEADKWADRADTVIGQANYTERLIIDAETGERGYLITRNPQFLEPYNNAQRKVFPAFDLLAYDARRTPHQVAHILLMKEQYWRWLTQAQYEINLATTQPSRLSTEFNKARGKQLMDGLRGQFDNFIAIETWLRSQRIQKASLQTLYTLIGSVALCLACGIGLGYMSSRNGKSFVRIYESALSASQNDQEMLNATLFGIGDGVLVTDAAANVTMMNIVAERLTGWTLAEAMGRNAREIFNIVNETTRDPVESPIDRVIKEGVIVGLANHTVLLRRDGSELPIDDSGAPIRDDKGNLVGVILVFRDVSDRKREEQRIEREYEREHRIAETLQRHLTMMPDSKDLRGMEVETVYLPALTEANVGGDFFDIYYLNDHKLALIVGDISGKGLEAAAHTAEVKFALRAYLHENHELATAITQFNAFLCQSYTRYKARERFVCISVVVIDTAERTAAICIAGSEQVLIATHSGEIHQRGINNPPIGVIDGYRFEEQRTSYQSGDVVALATDGITEARRHGAFLGIEGLAALLSSACGNGNIGLAAKTIVEEVGRFADGKLSDDVCFLLARLL